MTNLSATLGDLLEAASAQPRGVTFIEAAGEEVRVDYASLLDRALGVLHHFQERGLGVGDELILFTNSNEQFVDAFWACVLGGIIPVPVAVGISDDHRAKLLQVFATLRRPHLYTEQNLLVRLERYAQSQGREAEFSRVRENCLVVDDIERIGTPGQPHEAAPDDTAFIQFSSGSTSTPKGVVLTHSNVLANINAIIKGFGGRDDDIGLSWMPLTHDMGLIGFHLVMVAGNHEHHIMNTALFVRRPVLWLEKIAEHRATLTCSPNFGYKHLLKVFESKGPGDIDLSTVRLIFNGAEPISADLARHFLAAMAPLGLNGNVMFPVYGLAEASLGMTFPVPGAPLQTILAQRHELLVGKPWKSASQTDQEGAKEHPGKDAIEFVMLGTSLSDCELTIRDDDDRDLPDEHVGHVLIRGNNVTRGYYGLGPEDRTFHTADGWLRTGDLGMIHAGQLVITGRSKDIIFVNGQNYYPHDVENVALGVSGMELGKVAVAGVSNAISGTDEILMFVLDRGDVQAFADLARQLRRRVNEVTGLELAHVIPVARIPKTTSGKVQRHKLAEAYLDGVYADDIAQLAGFTQGPQADGEGDELEQALKAICNSIVIDRPVGLDDNLFDIGISSLALAQIHSRVDELYPGELDIADVFDHPSIRELAAFLESKRS